MRGIGGALLVGGIVALVGALGMDTSVSTGFGRVNNIGLMKDQQNYMLLSAIAIVAGLILLAVKPKVILSDSTNNNRSGNDQTKICSECAESIKMDAKICRYCGNRNLAELEMDEQEYTPPEYITPPPPPTFWQKLWWNPHGGRK